MSSSQVLIEAKGLTKKFEDVVAVDHVDFKVLQGRMRRFSWTNGAGKTTTVRMMYCFLPPTAGELKVAGLSVNTQCREIKSLVGVAPQEDNLDPDFTALKNLMVYCRYFDIPKDEA